MKGEDRHPGIWMHKMPVGANIGGLIFALGGPLVVYFGMPGMRIYFLSAIACGVVVAGILHFVRR